LTQFHADYTPLDDLEPIIAAEDLQKGEWWSLFHQMDHTNWERTYPTSIGFPSLTPWLMVEDSPVSLTYERNPYYYKVDEEGKQLPYIDVVSDKLVENTETIVLSVLAGEVDFLYEAGAMVSVPMYKENEEKGGYNTVILRSHTEPATVYFNLTFEEDVWRQVVQDVRFRQAVNLGLNRAEIIESVWLGTGAELPEHIPSEYDPDKANALLDELGLDQRDAEGFRLGPDGQTFAVPFEQNGRTPEMTPTCELVVEYLTELGLKTTMQTIAAALRSERSNANQLKATIERNAQPLWWQRYGGWYSAEWDRLWWNWHASGGESGEEPPPEVVQFHELSAQIRVVAPEQRQAVLDEVDQLLYDNIFFICPVEKERRPIIASKKMGNVAKDGFSIAACFAGEQLFYKE
jgi:peptide/nickel transport system substrate-binding protein